MDSFFVGKFLENGPRTKFNDFIETCSAYFANESELNVCNLCKCIESFFTYVYLILLKPFI